MGFQSVVLVIGLQYLWCNVGGIGFCKRVGEVVNEVVDLCLLLSSRHCITLSVITLAISFLEGAEIRTKPKTARMMPPMNTMRPPLLLSSF